MILHSYNITHNDIKPTNWVFLDSKPKLIDFGAAEKYYKGCFSAYPYDGKYCARPANETTYQFMSPEQVEYFIECLRTGNRAEICIDAKQSDVWSLGYAIVWMHKKELHRIPSPIEPSWFENADKVSKEIKQQVITEFVQFNKRRQQVLNDLKLPFPLDLVLLAECPSKRPTATQTVQCLVNGYFRACPINLKVALEIKHVVFPYRQATLNKLFVWVNRLKTDLKCFFESVAYLDYYLLKNQDNDLTKYLPSSTIKLRNIDTSTLKGQYLALGYVCVYLAWLCLEKRPFGEYIQHWSKSGEFATFVVQVSNHVKYIFHAHTSLMTEYQHLDLSARQDFFLTARQSLL
jgi:serine/threonine protein kinase